MMHYSHWLLQSGAIPANGVQLGNFGQLWGSSLFSVELEMGQAELAGDKVKHGDQIFAGTIAASFAFGSLEYAVEPFHEGVGQPPFPMRQDALEVGLDHLGDLEHREEFVAHMLLGDPAHPTAPRQKAVSGC